MELTTNYRVASIIKLNGFGVSVIQRLCKTSVKKNLYWEVKDKVIEEAFNGIRSVKRSQKVRVYGTDSNREVRARLIEILYDRVAFYKDKFVAPILHSEMQSMEVKKTGKVEHSQNSHDDQVFSYLMALYVWYDGKDLAEKFHIMKNTIRTDEDEEIEDNLIDDNIEAVERIDIDRAVADEDDELVKQLQYLESSNFTTTDEFKNQNYISMATQRDIILATNKNAREAYARDRGLDPDMFVNPSVQNGYTSLPQDLFLDDDFVVEDAYRNDSPLCGNLSDLWDKV